VGAISQRIGAPNMLLCQGAIAIIVAITFSGFLRKDKLDRKEIKKIADEENLITKTI